MGGGTSKFIEDQTPQKLRGGYYTPLDLASFIAAWIRDLRPSRVLEPSCGDGAFLQAIADVGGLDGTDIVAFELDDIEARKAKQRGSELGLRRLEVRAEDFLSWATDNLACPEQGFDAVVGNPPFVRYQFLPSNFQK
jgi:tRNA1(Val) A37 N6-methylase TrmN6